MAAAPCAYGAQGEYTCSAAADRTAEGFFTGTSASLRDGKCPHAFNAFRVPGGSDDTSVKCARTCAKEVGPSAASAVTRLQGKPYRCCCRLPK